MALHHPCRRILCRRITFRIGSPLSRAAIEVTVFVFLPGRALFASIAALLANLECAKTYARGVAITPRLPFGNAVHVADQIFAALRAGLAGTAVSCRRGYGAHTRPPTRLLIAFVVPFAPVAKLAIASTGFLEVWTASTTTALPQLNYAAAGHAIHLNIAF